MSKSRIKAPASAVRTREEMESLVGEITALKTREQKLTAEMNKRINDIRVDYDAALSGIAEEIDGKMALARDWAEAHPSEFGSGKSIDMTHGQVGWRTGNPTLKTLAGWTWDRVLERLRAGHWVKYLRIKQEPNKEALLADREAVALHEVGCRVVQDEKFFVDPKIETPEARVMGDAE